MPCEGAIDSWLGAFVHQLQTSLQHQVVTAMGVEQPCRRATLNSAGARKIATKHSKCMYDPTYFGSVTCSLFLPFLGLLRQVPWNTLLCDAMHSSLKFMSWDTQLCGAMHSSLTFILWDTLMCGAMYSSLKFIL